MHQAGDAVDDHQPHAGHEQPQARANQRLDLRPELFQIGLALGQIGLAGARAAAMRRALGPRAYIRCRRVRVVRPCARPSPSAARR